MHLRKRTITRCINACAQITYYRHTDKQMTHVCAHIPHRNTRLSVSVGPSKEEQGARGLCSDNSVYIGRRAYHDNAYPSIQPVTLKTPLAVVDVRSRWCSYHTITKATTYVHTYMTDQTSIASYLTNQRIEHYQTHLRASSYHIFLPCCHKPPM